MIEKDTINMRAKYIIIVDEKDVIEYKDNYQYRKAILQNFRRCYTRDNANFLGRLYRSVGYLFPSKKPLLKRILRNILKKL